MTSDKLASPVSIITDVTHSLSNVVDDNRAIGVPVVHRRQRFISFLPSSIPYFKFHCRVLVKRDCLCEERSADG
jgi:hypothetical protein